MLSETRGWRHGGRISFPAEARQDMLLQFEDEENVQTTICWLLTTSAPFATGIGLILIVIPLLNEKDLLHCKQRRT